jgi:hypothetical protein
MSAGQNDAPVMAMRHLAQLNQEGMNEMSTDYLGRLNIAEKASASLAPLVLLRWALASPPASKPISRN